VTTYRLGVNNCFAVKRWPEPAAWAALVRERLGLTLVQHSLDLVEPTSPAASLELEAKAVRKVCDEFGLEVHSTFTGLAAYSSSLLLHPNLEARALAEQWYGRMVDFAAALGAPATGGHVGAFSAQDASDKARRTELSRGLDESLERLTRRARNAGLSAFLIENLAPARGVQRLLARRRASHVPVRLYLDVGHMCTPGLVDPETDPYAWLNRFARSTEVVHLQQSDSSGDHHWPFTEEMNRVGRIDAQRVLSALDEGGADQVTLILEVIPAFEAADHDIVRDLEVSVSYWQDALAVHSGRVQQD
jgi:sugar phosphate isomerase/epimerase